MEKNAFTPYFQEYGLEIVSAILVVFFLFLMVFGAQILATGIFLGLITTVSFGLIVWEMYSYMPRVYNFIVDHPLLFDLACAVGFGAMFGLSVTGLIAAGTFGIFQTIAALNASKHLPRAEVKPIQWIENIKRKMSTDPTDIDQLESEVKEVCCV